MSRSVLTPLAVALLLLGACLAERERCHCGPASAPPQEAAPGPPQVLPDPSPPPPVLPDFTDPSWTRVPSRAGKYLVCWRAAGGKVPRNEDFELEAWILADGAPVRGAKLAVSAYMPEHGHGMLRLPRARESEDGSYRIEGMLLHMRGRWVLVFDVLEGTLSEAAECELVVK